MAMAPSQGHRRSGRKVHLDHVGGDVFSASHESSNRETLWSELFKEKERAAMRKHLVSRVLSFSIRDTYQISVRMMWTKEAQQHLDGQGGHETSPPPVAVLLHALSGKLTASWVWAKLVHPLYKANISVIMLDFPGFGMSRVNGESDVAQSTWIEKDWRIVLQLMDALHVRKCHFITCGESCNTVLKMMKEAKLRLELTHIFFNPVISLDEVFPLRAKAGVSQESVWAAKTEQRHEFEMLMHNSMAKIWTVFDQSTPLTLDSKTMLCSFAALPFARGQIVVTQLGEQHACSASAGSTVDVPILFPCRWLRHGFIRFLKRDPTFKPPASLLVEHGDGDQADTSHLSSGAGSEGAQTDGGSPSRASWKGAHVSAGAGGFSPGSFPEKFFGLELQALSKNSSDFRLTMQALSRNCSDNGIAMQALSRNSESRMTTPSCPIFGDLTSSEQFFGLGPRASAAQIRKATSLASRITRADVHREREGFLVNTKAVTKLKNWSELRGAENDWGPGVTAEEAEWIEDALDFSMHTFETDEERRITKPLSAEERYKALQDLRLNGEGKKKRTADSQLLKRDPSRPEEPPGTTYSRDAKSNMKRMATSKGTRSLELIP